MVHHLVEVPIDALPADILAARLWADGAVGIEERPHSLVAAFADPDIAGRVADRHGVACRPVADTTGLDAWRDHAGVWPCGPFVLHPPWVDPPASGRPMAIDPGHAFGSGAHASTRLALLAFTELVPAAGGDRPGSVADVGCGAGVLAIGAALLGSTVVAVDTDPEAVRVTRANVERNGCGDLVDTRLGSAQSAGAADVAVVNLTIDGHEDIAPAIHDHVRPRVVVASGLLVGDHERRSAAAHRGRVAARVTEGDWAAVVLITARP